MFYLRWEFLSPLVSVVPVLVVADSVSIVLELLLRLLLLQPPPPAPPPSPPLVVVAGFAGGVIASKPTCRHLKLANQSASCSYFICSWPCTRRLII